MRTYYIVEHNDRSGKFWRAHYRGVFSTLGIYGDFNFVPGTIAFKDADECERLVRIKIEKPKVIRVVRC